MGERASCPVSRLGHRRVQYTINMDDETNTDDETRSEVTRLLLAWSDGDAIARDRLMVLLQDELRRMAHGRLAQERNDITLETLDLVQEMVMRLLKRDTVAWQSSAQFRGEASKIMRLVLIDHARQRRAKRRNEGVRPAALDRVPDVSLEERDDQWISLDDALGVLESVDLEQYEVILRHYFGGQTCVEIGEDMGLPEIRAKRRLKSGRAFLRQVMADSESGES